MIRIFFVMRLEYITDGSLDHPLIRLFDFTPAEAARLKTSIADSRKEMLDAVLPSLV